MIFLDQALKHWVFSYQWSGQENSLFHLTRFLNQQFAFSLPLPTRLIFLVDVIVLTLIIFYTVRSFRLFSPIERMGWLMVLAGSFSNFGERLITGHVRDYLYLYGGGIINLADCYIGIGIAILLIHYWFHRKVTRGSNS